MTRDARLAQAGNFSVGQDPEGFKRVGNIAEAGTQDHAQLGLGLGEGFFDSGEGGIEGFAINHGVGLLSMSDNWNTGMRAMFSTVWKTFFHSVENSR